MKKIQERLENVQSKRKEMVQIRDSSFRKMYAKALIVIHKGYFLRNYDPRILKLKTQILDFNYGKTVFSLGLPCFLVNEKSKPNVRAENRHSNSYCILIIKSLLCLSLPS